jgi:hypothetical protein
MNSQPFTRKKLRHLSHRRHNPPGSKISLQINAPVPAIANQLCAMHLALPFGPTKPTRWCHYTKEEARAPQTSRARTDTIQRNQANQANQIDPVIFSSIAMRSKQGYCCAARGDHYGKPESTRHGTTVAAFTHGTEADGTTCVRVPSFPS